MLNLYDLQQDEDGRAKLVKLRTKKRNSVKCVQISNPKILYDVCCQELGMDRLTEEVFYMFAVNAAHMVIGACMVSKGTAQLTLVGVREIFVRALLLGANYIFLAHNHPSGVTSPSAHDISVTETLRKAGELLTVQMVDHIIVSKQGYYSFKEST